MPGDERMQLRLGLWDWLVNGLCDSDAHFVRNKFAHTLVRLFRLEYPETWPNFFNELLSLVGPNLHATLNLDMFLRICSNIDEDIAALQIQRTSDEIARNSIVKDAMRLEAIPRLVQLWKGILAQFPNDPVWINPTLKLFAQYIGWIDVNLLYPDMMPTIYQYLGQPSLRDEALEFLAELVHKGMKPAAKISMMQALDLPSVLQTMPTSDAFSKVVNSAGSDLCALMEDLTSDQVSSTLVLMDSLVPCMCRALTSRDDEAYESILPFLSLYLSTLKRLKKQNFPGKSQHVNLVFDALIQRCRFEPDATGFGPIFDSTDDELEARKALKAHLEGIATIDGELFNHAVEQFCLQTLDRLSAKQQMPWTDVELALFLVFSYHDCVKISPNYSRGTLSELLRRVLTSGVATYPHASIPPIFFEILARYAPFFDANPDLIPLSLEAFVGLRGLHYQDHAVKARINHLFLKFVKTIKHRLAPFVQPLLMNMQDLVAIPPLPVPMEPLLDLFEAMGHLLSISDASQQMTRTVLLPYLNMVKNILDQKLYDSDAPDNAYTAQVTRIIQAIGSLAKGFPDYVKNKNEAWAESFRECMEATLATLTNVSKCAPIREACRYTLQILLNVIGLLAEPYVTHMFNMQVLVQCDAAETVDYLALFCLLNHKFQVTESCS